MGWTLPGGFSPRKALNQIGDTVNPFDGKTDYDVFGNVSVRGGDRSPADGSFIGTGETKNTAPWGTGGSVIPTGGTQTGIPNSIRAPSGGQTAAQQQASAQAAAESRARAAELAYLDDQQNQANAALGRIGDQRNIGNQNIESSYNQSLQGLLNSSSRAKQDYDLTKGRDLEDNRNARASTDRSVARSSTGLQRLLGSQGAGSSSAAQILAPFAVARQGTERLGEIQSSFGRNQQNLDLGFDRTKEDEKNQRSALDLEKIRRGNELEAGLLQNEAGIRGQLSNFDIARAKAQGQDYTQIRGDVQGYNNTINQLLSRIDQLGNQFQNAIGPAKGVTFDTPDLSQYNTGDLSRGRLNPELSAPVQDQVGGYYNLLGLDDEDKRQL